LQPSENISTVETIVAAASRITGERECTRMGKSQEDDMNADVKQAFQLLNRQLADISKTVTDTGKDVDAMQKVMKYNLGKLNICVEQLQNIQ
jgi:hypothetical protein